MTKRMAAVALGMMLGWAVVPGQAADFVNQNTHGATQCIRAFTSPMLDLPREEMVSAVHQKYDHSLEVSERQSVVYNQSQLFTWASEAKVSCAKAVGFLKHGEANAEQISQCDCYYSRMRLLMH